MGTVTTNNPYGTTSQVVTTNSDGSKDVKTYAGLNGSGSLIEEAAVTAANVVTIISPIFTQSLTFTLNLIDSAHLVSASQTTEPIIIEVIYDPNQAPTFDSYGDIPIEYFSFSSVAKTIFNGATIYENGTSDYFNNYGNVKIEHSQYLGGSDGFAISGPSGSVWYSPAKLASNSLSTENFFSIFTADLSAIQAAQTADTVGFATRVSAAFGTPTYSAYGDTLAFVGASASSRSLLDPGADGLFDPDYYLNNNAAAYARLERPEGNTADVPVIPGEDALADYMATGWKEGADPSAGFSTAGYLSAHPDAAASGIDPLTYYENVGKAMGETVTTVAQWAAANAPPANTGSGGSTTTGGTVPVTPIVSTPTGSTSGGTSAGTSTPTTVPITPATIAVYRFFDKADGTHFFTASASERATIDATRPDMTDEGAGLNSVQPTDPNAVAVYRFFDTRFGTHFFTASSTERDNVIASRADLTYEGVGFYEHGAKQGGDVAVYRFFDTVHGTHFYSSSASEVAQIAATRTDLTNEGVGFYAPGTAST